MFNPIPLPSAPFSRLASFALQSTAKDIPVAVKERAALLLLDTLGICAAATQMQAGRIARDTTRDLYGAGRGPGVPMLFDGRRVSPAGVVFAAATQTDNLDAHDGFNLTKGHIGVAVVPTLAALAHDLPDLSGPDALTALVLGYEIAGRAGIALHATVADFHTSGAWNALGVAALAARLKGLNADQLRHALGIAEYHGPRSQMMREIANPTMLHDGSGMGALAGLSAAVMAEKGFTGAPAITLEAPEAAPYWENLGQHWLTEDQYIKPYPICRWAHAPINAAERLRTAHGIDHRQIARITIRSFAEAIALYPGMPDHTARAQYALAFPVAAMLVNGRIGLPEISGPGLNAPDVARLVALTEGIVDQRHQARFPAERWAEVEITLADGTVLASGEVTTSGGPEEPFDALRLRAKFHDYAGPVLGHDRAKRLEAAVLSLTEPGARFAPVNALISEAP
ncbi:MmgE/PrpD family protein [Nioella nitratireducens]|uniref:MmgE/PrpD family protein n=1 Tax=Nioella nitratireducens TaxID=1287720 RepID=UPI0008FD88F6|nr:MmgE/PrpD family protein [Nioella nitratireducens]